MKMITPASPTRRSHHPRTPTQRAIVSKKANSSVRLAPETAVRWSQPSGNEILGQLRAKSRRCRQERGQAPALAALGDDPTTACRNPSRTRSTSRGQGEGAPTTTGEPRTRTTAATSEPRSGVSKRPSTTDSTADRDRNHSSTFGPLTTRRSGARTSQMPPRPSTRTVAVFTDGGAGPRSCPGHPMRVCTNLQLGRHDRPVRRQRRDRSMPEAVHIDEASAEQHWQ